MKNNSDAKTLVDVGCGAPTFISRLLSFFPDLYYTGTILIRKEMKRKVHHRTRLKTELQLSENCTATHCNPLQPTATHYTSIHPTAPHCSTRFKTS